MPAITSPVATVVISTLPTVVTACVLLGSAGDAGDIRDAGEPARDAGDTGGAASAQAAAAGRGQASMLVAAQFVVGGVLLGTNGEGLLDMSIGIKVRQSITLARWNQAAVFAAMLAA